MHPALNTPANHAAAPAAIIQADNICVSYGEQCVLDKVSLTVTAGDFITIIGPNGAGKSTLIKCLLGLIRPQHGQVYRASGVPFGYVPQQITPALSMPLTLKRFLTLNNQCSDSTLQQNAELTGITDCLNHPLSGLSGGQRQRALLARALINQPALLALDEPAQNLDVRGEMAFYRLLESICEQRKIAVIMVSHDLHFVMRRSRQVICLYRHICCSGAPLEVSRNPAFTEIFGSDVSQLLTVYHHHEHHHDHDHHDHMPAPHPQPTSPLTAPPARHG